MPPVLSPIHRPKLTSLITMDTSLHLQAPSHVVMVPTPGMGHLIPLVELAKRLVQQHDFLVTLLVPNDGSPMKPQRRLLEALPNTISSIFLPLVGFDDLPQTVKVETRIVLSLSRSLSALRGSFKALTEASRVVALVVDLFGLDAIEIAREFDVLLYVFFPTTAMALSSVFHLPKLDETYSCEYRDLPEPVKFPGCVPVHGRDLMDPVQNRKDDAYRWVIHISKLYPLAAGILVNSFIDLEAGAFKALMEDRNGTPPIYPVGPLTRTASTSEIASESESLRWLDRQPNGSVLFVSFGSGGTLSHGQFIELALGLEMSGQRFLWVVRSPHDRSANANYFDVQNVTDPLDFLPEGFLDRTKGLGLVVPHWAPQMQVLSHGATGAFLSHCGWNSSLESIVNGVPIIAWPLYAEQKMNSVLLADDLKVALRVRVNENGLVVKEDIANYASTILKGEEGQLLRKRMKELKNTAVRVLSQDGSSTKSLAHVANLWKNQRK